jgi:uncharacterized protein (TIGR03435 family)
MRPLLLLCAAVAAGAQSPPAFEVISIKPASPEARGMNIHRDPGGRFTASNVNIRTLILLAYKIQDFQLSGGPAWIRTDRYDVIAMPPEGTPREFNWEMLKSLLADRCKLEAHQETREIPTYDLVAAKSGSKLQPIDRPPSKADGSFTQNGGVMKDTGVTMDDLTLQLSGIVRRIVHNRTGLEGRFDFKIEYTPDYEQRAGDSADSRPAPDHPPLMVALQEQLGLKLEPAKGPVEIVVIDRVEKPTEN